MSGGYIPSFAQPVPCGHAGDRFMQLAKSGQIANCCQPNALMTLKEYLVDYTSDKTRALGESLIEKEMKIIQAKSKNNCYKLS